MIDVESYERALELAAYVSSEPGPGGEPRYEWIDVREVMSEAPSQDWPGVIDEPIRRVDEGVLHAPVPRVLAGLVRRVQREEQHPGRYQIDAALHDDAAGAEETDWPQILAWHDDLVARWHAVRGHLHELGGDLPAAGAAYAEAAHRATDVAERDHLVRQAARARAGERGMSSRLIERPS